MLMFCAFETKVTIIIIRHITDPNKPLKNLNPICENKTIAAYINNVYVDNTVCMYIYIYNVCK